ncbi:MAG: peptidase [Myxococcales bacterium]|nr:peptidase [Myxococcales bacterium]
MNRAKRSLPVAPLVLLVAAAAFGQERAPAPPAPPVAARRAHSATIHGKERADDYYWLRDKKSPEVLSYLRAEAEYADAMLAPTRPLQDRLYAEMLSHIQEDDVTPPYRDGAFEYYARTNKGKQYATWCRKRAADGPEEVLLDLNALAVGHKFISRGAMHPSDDGTLLAYSTDVTGFREYTLYIKDLAKGALLPEQVDKVETFAWAADGKTLFYVTEDAAKRGNRLWRHRLGQPVAKDALVYEEKDERFRVRVQRTRSRNLLTLVSASHTASEVRFVEATKPTAPWRLIAARENDHEYYADERDGRFYIYSNKLGRNFRVVSAPVADPRPQNWTELIAHRPDVMVEDLLVFKGFLVIAEREDALAQLRVIDLKDPTAASSQHRVRMPEADYETWADVNLVFDTDRLRFGYTSFTTPNSWFDYDMKTRVATLVKRTPVPGGFDPARYVAERVHAVASDGARVPISLVHKVGVARDGKGPLLLTGYGSYGVPEAPFFDATRLPLLDRGITYAVAHIRGGGDLGKKWHDDGRMMHKRNTFTDFIASAEWLQANKYTARDRLAIMGGSAGGLLIGAVVNMRPELFKVALAYVPFVDVINTMLDETLPLTVGEFEEWGNPKKPDEYAYMMSYSPYDNVKAQRYPSMFVRSALNDSQVMYWEPAKWVARLRANKADRNPLLFKINMDPAGHGGAAGRYDKLHEKAYDDAFLLQQLGVRD